MRPLILVPTINSRHWNACYFTAAVCTEMPAPPTGRALLLGGGGGPPQQQSAAAGGGSAMSLVVQGGYRAVSGRSCSLSFEYTIHIERPPRRLQRKMGHNIWTAILASGSELEKQLNELYKARSIRRFRKVVVLSIFFSGYSSWTILYSRAHSSISWDIRTLTDSPLEGLRSSQNRAKSHKIAQNRSKNGPLRQGPRRSLKLCVILTHLSCL